MVIRSKVAGVTFKNEMASTGKRSSVGHARDGMPLLAIPEPGEPARSRMHWPLGARQDEAPSDRLPKHTNRKARRIRDVFSGSSGPTRI